MARLFVLPTVLAEASSAKVIRNNGGGPGPEPHLCSDLRCREFQCSSCRRGTSCKCSCQQVVHRSMAWRNSTMDKWSTNAWKVSWLKWLRVFHVEFAVSCRNEYFIKGMECPGKFQIKFYISPNYFEKLKRKNRPFGIHNLESKCRGGTLCSHTCRSESQKLNCTPLLFLPLPSYSLT